MKILLGNISEFFVISETVSRCEFFGFFLDVSFVAISWYDILAVK